MSTDPNSVPPRPHFGLRGVDMSAKDKSAMLGSRSKAPGLDTDQTKRTAVMTLAAIGAGAFGLWAFAASGNTKDVHGKIYNSAQHCTSDGAIAQNDCLSLWRTALVVHNSNAPAYQSKLECDAAHGASKCVQPVDAAEPQRRGQFIPQLAGYVMGKLAFGGYQAAPLYKLKDDERHKYRMSALPPPVKDREGRSVSAFVWISRTAKVADAAKPVGRPLFGKDGKVGSPKRGGFGQVAKASAGG